MYICTYVHMYICIEGERERGGRDRGGEGSIGGGGIDRWRRDR